MANKLRPGYYSLAPNGTSRDYMLVRVDGTEALLRCLAGYAVHQVDTGEILCLPSKPSPGSGREKG